MIKNKARTVAVTAVAVFIAVFAVTGGVHAQSVDNAPPTAPTGVSAYVSTTSNQVVVSWGASNDNVGVIGYYLYRNGQLIVNSPGYTTYTDTVSPGTYYYTVSAYDAAGNVSAQSGGASITVTADTQAPTVPTNLSATIASSSIVLSWYPSSDNVGVVGYYVSRNGVRIITGTSITGSSYTDSGLTYGTYRYTVQAYDGQGNVSAQSAPFSATLVFDDTPPATPQRPTLKVVSPYEIDLSWSPTTDNIAVTGYTIYRDGSLLTSVGTTTLTYPDGGLSPQTTHNYTVAAFDLNGNISYQSAPAVATTMPLDTTAPSIPQNISAVAASPSQVDLSWSASTDNVGVAGYEIFRDGDEIANAVSTTYVDTGLATSSMHLYAVKAYDAAGNVSPQTSVGVTTLANTPAVPIGPTVVPPVVVQAPVNPASTPPAVANPGVVFTTGLSLGLRNSAITNLQIFLIAQGYLAPGLNTGYYGALTQAAVQKFQCAEAIVCSGTPVSTGWGSVGPRTRAALNQLY